MEEKILYLPLKKKWYEMIESYEKPEEYREDKPYWRRRLYKGGDWRTGEFKDFYFETKLANGKKVILHVGRYKALQMLYLYAASKELPEYVEKSR